MQIKSRLVLRVLISVLAQVAFVIVVLFGFGDSVAAKGLVSVTITGPGMAHPIELLDTANIDLLTRLMEQTGLRYGTGDLPTPLEELPRELGPSYTLAWIDFGPLIRAWMNARSARSFIWTPGMVRLSIPRPKRLSGVGNRG